MISLIINIANDEIIQALGFGMALLVVLAYLIAMLVAIIGHELAHGYVALWNGDKTAKFLGRLSPNPAKHFDLVGLLMMLCVGFGWAKPVPIDPRNFKNYKKSMTFTALAGVTYNLIVGIFSLLFLSIIQKTTGIMGSTIDSVIDGGAKSYLILFFCYLFSTLALLNFSLMVFNLLPIYPLDGFRVVETLSKPNNRYVNFMYKYGAQVMLIFVLVTFFLGRFIPQLDILSYLIRLVCVGFDKLFALIFGMPSGFFMRL